MSIPGQQNINVGLPNQVDNSDSLYDAFNKINNNFSNLFSLASPYLNFAAGHGISTESRQDTGTVTITNTGVTKIIAGTNIVIDQSNGNVTISSTGTGGSGGGSVTSVGITPVSTSRIVVTNSPIVSSGIISIDLATSGVTAGIYANPTITVDAYGRIRSAVDGSAALNNAVISASLSASAANTALSQVNTAAIQVAASQTAVASSAASASASAVIASSAAVTATTQAGIATAGVNSIRSDLASAEGASLIGLTTNTAGSVTRTIQDKLIQFITPEDFGAVSDLNGDTGTDNTAAFRALAIYANAHDSYVVINGKYRITGGFTILRGTWEFIGDAVIRNTTKNQSSFWKNTAVFIGSYFGYNAASGMNAEPNYYINPVLAGATSITCVTPSQAGNFSVGSKIYLLDANKISGLSSDFRKASHMSIVTSSNSSTGVVSFKHPVLFAIDSLTTSPYTPAVAITPTGTLVQTDPELIAAGGATPTLAENVKVINGAFESANLLGGISCQTVHIACHGCDLDFRWISGGECIGANPVTDSKIEVRDSEYSQVLFELAYYHFRVTGDIIRGRRISGRSNSGVSPVSFNEYGHSCDFGLIDVSDLIYAGDLSRATVNIGTPYVRIKTLNIINGHNNALNIGYNGGTALGTGIEKILIRGQVGTGRTCVIDSDQVNIDYIAVDNTSTTQPSIQITAACGPNIFISKARLSSGPGAGTQYRIVDLRSLNQRKHITNIRGHYTQERVLDLSIGTNYTSASTGVDTTAKTYVVSGNQSGRQTKWDVHVDGTIATGTTNRIIKLLATQLTLTASSNFLDTETITIAGKTYTFQTTLTNVDGNIQIGATLAASLINIAAAINLSAGAGTLYATATTINSSATASYDGTHLYIASKTNGVVITVAETATNASWASGTALFTLTYAAGNSGAFDITGMMRKVGTNAGLNYKFMLSGPPGTLTSTVGQYTGAFASADTYFALVVNTTAGENITIREWSVTPYDDETENI